MFFYVHVYKIQRSKKKAERELDGDKMQDQDEDLYKCDKEYNYFSRQSTFLQWTYN